MLGFILTIIIVGFISVGILASVIAFAKKTDKSEILSNSVLQIKLNQQINDRADNSPFATFQNKKTIGLNEILNSIKAAKTDNKIKGIYLDLSEVNAGIASVEEIRNTLLDFKNSKKFIISYSESYTQKAYYLASVADDIIINPEGLLEFKGVSANVMFFKGALQKLEIEPEVIRHGKFKSAVEPFILDKMSEANKEQTKEFIGSIWSSILKGVSESRKISVDNLNFIADSLKMANSESALKYKMVDHIMFKDEVFAKINELLKAKKDDKINFVSLGKYSKSPKVISFGSSSSADKIAVIYASGDIVSGDGGDDAIGSENFSSAIRDARLDKKVKAIVLRINSPGGSALASEIIWREIVLAKKEKPVVVSMGNLAASGGYYIACPADKIIASPNTITGSIGVFGILFNTKKLMNNKLGITFDGVKTNAYLQPIQTIIRI